jgi:hypothetical protein
MGNIFSSFKCKIHPDNRYKIKKTNNIDKFDKFVKKIYSKKRKYYVVPKTIIKNKSISDLEGLCLLPMSRHGSIRISKSLNFLNLMI